MTRGYEVESSVADVIDRVASSAKKRKVSQFDAYAVCKKARRVSIERGGMSGADVVLATGLHVRVCSDKRVGGAFCNRFDVRSISETIAQAIRIARLMEPNPMWRDFPSGDGKYPSVNGIHDKAVASLSIDVMSAMAEEMIDSAMTVSKDVSTPDGGVESVERAVGIVNSSGVSSVMVETELHALICCVAGSGSSVSPDCEARGMSRSCDLRMDKMGERAGWVADRSRHLVEAKTEESDVVFSPVSLGSADSGLLNIVLSKALSGQRVSQKISFLADQVGDKVWSEHVTFNDNPLLSGRCGSRPFDDEGVPSRRTKLVSKGVLEGFLWDSYYGSVSGEGSTGNAIRDLYSGAVRPAPLCLQLAAGRGSMASLIESVDHGYLVWSCQGAHTSNTETGGFSFVASPGLLIENGEIVGGVRGAMVSGNVSDLLANVERVGADVTDFGSALMPSVLFKDVNITTG
jgi:PmbA protein